MLSTGERIVQAGQRVQYLRTTHSCSTKKQRRNCWEVIWMLLPLVQQRKPTNTSRSWHNFPKQEFPPRELISSSPQCWQVYSQVSALQRGNTCYGSRCQGQAGWGCCICTLPTPFHSVRGPECPLPRQKTLRGFLQRGGGYIMVCLLQGGAQTRTGRMLFHRAPWEMESPAASLSCCSPHGPAGVPTQVSTRPFPL